MWQRRTFHECASELDTISLDFRYAYTNRWNWDRAQRDRVMRDASIRGVEVLRILALSIRSDQDYGLTENVPDCVGALRNNIHSGEAHTFIRAYRPPYTELAAFSPLRLRQALNKVAHANPAGSGFFADAETHDLILTGIERENNWLAVISLIDLCKIIKLLPDARTRHEI